MQFLGKDKQANTIHTKNKNSTLLFESITLSKNVVSIICIYLSETSTVIR